MSINLWLISIEAKRKWRNPRCGWPYGTSGVTLVVGGLTEHSRAFASPSIHFFYDSNIFYKCLMKNSIFDGKRVVYPYGLFIRVHIGLQHL